jgi:hypothetical protein
VVFDEWLRAKESELSSATLGLYRRIIANQIAPSLGEHAFGAIGTADLEAFLSDLDVDELSASSRYQIDGILRQAFAWARDTGLIVRDPTEWGCPSGAPVP